MPDIYIFRHAHVDYTPPAQITEHNPLTPLGHEMAQRLAERCDAWDLQHLFVSSMLRTRQTAAPILARFPELPCTLMDDLQETNATDLSGFEGPMPSDDLYTWQEEHFVHANASTWRRIVRAWQAINRVVVEQNLDRVGLMSHGAAINALVRQWMGEPVETMRSHWIEFDWCAASCLCQEDGHRSVRWMNDAHHIDPLRDRLAALS